ncbi:MAG: glutamate synthase large subunit [Gammaproteobacteria bacterium]|nr:glutamate synthase large subunit [Gammaproteobacteria bacterium]
MTKTAKLHQCSLYQSEFEHDACGFGLMAQLDCRSSHELLQQSIDALTSMRHRGAVAADGVSSDGSGLLFNLPQNFLRSRAAELGVKLTGEFGVGQFYLSQDKARRKITRDIIERVASRFAVRIVLWRTVPTRPDVAGELARASLPAMEQAFCVSEACTDSPEVDIHEWDFEHRLFLTRKLIEREIGTSDPGFCIASLSSTMIAYKGLINSCDLPLFYPDLADPSLEIRLVVFHQRFSTNTEPSWSMVQPFHYLAHNGEINTISGNRRWAYARRHKLLDNQRLRPLLELDTPVKTGGSDSSTLDSMLDLIVAGGLNCLLAMRILIPPAWASRVNTDHSLRKFYKLFSMRMEPWDGPAGIVFSDGRYAACCLDRNGLRPARWMINNSNVITLASEYGVNQTPPEKVKAKGRLGPGQMLAVDTLTGQLLLDDDLNEMFKKHMHESMSASSVRRLMPLESHDDKVELQSVLANQAELGRFEKQFQVSFEEIEQIVAVLCNSGMEAIGSMGDDTPLPVISQQRRSLYDSFRQVFAQVTNPPIDSLREGVVMSLEVSVGSEGSFFDDSTPARQLSLLSPILSRSRFQFVAQLNNDNFRTRTFDLNIDSETPLPQGLQELTSAAVEAVRRGVNILVLDDSNLRQSHYPIHALLATGAVHHALCNAGLRCDCSIIVSTATARDPHHIAVLIGYGATAVYPYLAFDLIGLRLHPQQSPKNIIAYMRNYRNGLNKGLLKIMSKIGISVLASYRGAQLYEIVGLDDEITEVCFKGSPSRIQGLKFADLESDLRDFQRQAWDARCQGPVGGLLKFMNGGEYHAFNPDIVTTLQRAVKTGQYDDYLQYADLVNNRPAAALRDLWRLRADRCTPVPIAEVESVENIMTRFDTAGMSLGALSPEAHETLAQAMNYIGGRSNSGEGGEDPMRHGTNKTSKIKQVASGRFGVTPEYLVSAEVLQIKIAQGAKPGEGGQLPGDKVNQMIATLRCSTPGVSLISPPPHHDIYSIEDLAQLIYDLKQINEGALVSVKLVALAGVGTIAVGVAKAYADLITIAGYDGGTGASPMTSVKYAGSPWELGLPETHQMLCANRLRSRVRLQVDGGLKTGLDVVKGAIMGAESFGFGTVPMIAMGCKYLRICHLNNCATGVATQVPVLRMKHFAGTAERVVNYFSFVAAEVRQLMASVGIRQLTDLIGRTDLLSVIDNPTDKTGQPDFSRVLYDNHHGNFSVSCTQSSALRPAEYSSLNEDIMRDCRQAVMQDSGGEFNYSICNLDRSVGARLSGLIATHHGSKGLDKPIHLKFKGVAGQSFGCWNAKGIHLSLEGDANDYVGKGMSGGSIVLRHDRRSTARSAAHPVAGNTCLYGATGGQLLASGSVGERFAVRNSGATAVVEGAGDHCCEYMTGGIVIVLGETGINFGAGMTGGMAMVYDADGRFTDYYNHEMIDIHRIGSDYLGAYQLLLQDKLTEHLNQTDSAVARDILSDFYNKILQFWLIKPKAIDLGHLLEILRMAA